MTTENPRPLDRKERFAVAMRVFFLLIVMGLVAAIVVGQQEILEVGAIAPPVHAQSYDGRAWDLSMFAGKPVFVNFWGSWCPPCLAELPALVDAHARYGDRVQFVGLAVDSRPNEVFDVIKRFGIAYPIAGTDAHTVQAWHAEMLPSSMLLDAEHRVLWSGSGQMTRGDVDALFTKVLGAK